jgi:GxxExxY protein
VEPELSRAIIRAFFDVYNELGVGLLEVLYSRALEVLLRERGYRVEREHAVLVHFRGHEIGMQRLDMLVERRVIIEVKSRVHLPPGARLQLRSYVRASGLRLGILLHFGPRPVFFRELGRRPSSSELDAWNSSVLA